MAGCSQIRGRNLGNYIFDVPLSALYTDALLSYVGLAGDYAHQVIDHAVQYVDGNVHTNCVGSA